MIFPIRIPVFERLWPSKHNKYLVFAPRSFSFRLFLTTPATYDIYLKFSTHCCGCQPISDDLVYMYEFPILSTLKI